MSVYGFLTGPQGYYDERLMPLCVLRVSRWKIKGVAEYLGIFGPYRCLLRYAKAKSLND